MKPAHRLPFYAELRQLSYLGGLEGQNNSILEVVTWTPSRNCKDSRDKIYSILGIVRPEEAVLLIPDYSDSYTSAMTFADASCAVINGHRSLRLLAFVELGRPRDPHLPSCAIDFSNRTFNAFLHRYQWSAVEGWPKDLLPIRDDNARDCSLCATRYSLHFIGLISDHVKSDIYIVAEAMYYPEMVSLQLIDTLQEVPEHDAY